MNITKILMINGSLMYAKVLQTALLQNTFEAFYNTYDQHRALIGVQNQVLVFVMNGGLRQVLLYMQLGWIR